MKKFCALLLGAYIPILSGCDLQPKIASIPDSVGDFISERYPALLADPDTQPEIYNSAAADYGVYASPELYGSVSGDDYVLYSSVSDYIIPPQVNNNATTDESVTVVADNMPEQSERSDTGDDVLNTKPVTETDAVAENEETSSDDELPTDDVLMVPMYGGVDFGAGASGDDVVVVRGDTLYKIAQRHGTTVAELALVNNLREPYSLSVGQRLQLPGDTPVVSYVAVNPQQPDVPIDKKAETPVQKKLDVAPQAKAESKVVIEKPKPTTTRVQLQEITVAPGDTLYSVSRRYSVPVNDLAVMNDLSAPFGLRVGQTLKVPNLSSPSVHIATSVTPKATSGKGGKTSDAIVVKTASPVATKTVLVQADKTTARASSDKAKKTPDTQPKKGTKDNTPIKTDKKTDDKKSTPNKAAQKQPNKQQTQTKKTKQVDDKKVQKNTNQKSGNTNTKTKQKISSDPNKALPKIAPRSSSKFSWPVRGKILSHFGAKSKGLFNDGINISATRGTAVHAAENGVVAYAGNEVKGMGNLVIIQHADGWMTVYAHMDSMNVRRGTQVNVGQKIGTVGATGRVDKPQLHFEIRKGTKAYNPSQYLKK